MTNAVEDGVQSSYTSRHLAGVQVHCCLTVLLWLWLTAKGGWPLSNSTKRARRSWTIVPTHIAGPPNTAWGCNVCQNGVDSKLKLTLTYYGEKWIHKEHEGKVADL
jgi:hypothetical protein